MIGTYSVIGNWWLQEKLGSGYSGSCSLTFQSRILQHPYSRQGTIYKAVNIHTRQVDFFQKLETFSTIVHVTQVVALKVQDIHHPCPTNRYERALYPFLQGGIGIPTLWATGIEGQWDYLAIDLLGPSLEMLHKASRRDTMDLRSVCCIAMQVVSFVIMLVAIDGITFCCEIDI